ncbi:unnamed protein product [Sphenostylis stenocarpa]|uniref:Uncharacterized protein n=1 Tax=Sphenostylis stenocarpa TaxID=92480 RepID=A0AA86S667_9FABA|nr:unnamed protein product [Sphenostylis stenocarpa]
MAYGSNDKRGTTNNRNSTQDDTHAENNHHIINVSAPSVTATISLPNNPRPTPNHFPRFSGTVQSFNNCGGGLQDFTHAEIKTPAAGDSFNNLGSGSQTFTGAKIHSADKSSQLSKSVFPWKRDHVANHGTLHSFNNKGKGSQSFDGFKLN